MPPRRSWATGGTAAGAAQAAGIAAADARNVRREMVRMQPILPQHDVAYLRPLRLACRSLHEQAHHVLARLRIPVNRMLLGGERSIPKLPPPCRNLAARLVLERH